MNKLFMGLFTAILASGCAGEFDLNKEDKKDQSIEISDLSSLNSRQIYWTQDYIKFIYNRYLLREPDENGLAHWTEEVLESRISFIGLKIATVNSVESYAIRLWMDGYLDGSRTLEAGYHTPRSFWNISEAEISRYFSDPNANGNLSQGAKEILTEVHRSEIVSMLRARRPISEIREYILDEIDKNRIDPPAPFRPRKLTISSYNAKTYTKRAFEKYLLRAPDEQGEAYWIKEVAEGRANLDELFVSTMNSIEGCIVRLWIDGFLDREATLNSDYKTPLRFNQISQQHMVRYYGSYGRTGTPVYQAKLLLSQRHRITLINMFKGRRTLLEMRQYILDEIMGNE